MLITTAKKFAKLPGCGEVDEVLLPEIGELALIAVKLDVDRVHFGFCVRKTEGEDDIVAVIALANVSFEHSALRRLKFLVVAEAQPMVHLVVEGRVACPCLLEKYGALSVKRLSIAGVSQCKIV